MDVFIFFFLLSVQILRSVMSELALHCLSKSFFLTFKRCLAVQKPLSVASELALYSLF